MGEGEEPNASSTLSAFSTDRTMSASADERFFGVSDGAVSG